MEQEQEQKQKPDPFELYEREIQENIDALRPANELKDTDGGFPFIFELIEGSTKRRKYWDSKEENGYRWCYQFIPTDPFSPNVVPIKATRTFHKALDNTTRMFHHVFHKDKDTNQNLDASPSQPETSHLSPHGAQTQQTARSTGADGPPASTAD